jgi:hypothetical protein
MTVARPQRIYDFIAFARRTPNAQLPADRLDAQLQNHADAIAATQLAVEKLAEVLTQTLRPALREATLPTPSLYVNAGGPYATSDAGATATSADYAQVSIEWAEHMPDTIPPNVLAINAISGAHWSSRWWAARAAAYFAAVDVPSLNRTHDLVFDSVASVAVAEIPSVVNNIVCLSYSAPGDLGGETMTLIRVGSSSVPGYIVRSADGAYWGLSNQVVTPQMFGAPAVGDASHDDYPAIAAALAFSEAAVDAVTGIGSVTLHFPQGKYYSSQTIHILANQRVTGEGLGLYLVVTCAIQFPAGVTGVSVDYPRTGGSWGASIEGVDLIGTTDPTGASSNAHGVASITPLKLHRVNCASFGGDGFHLMGFNAPPGLPGSVDLSRVDECNAWNNQQSGFYFSGQDANVITVIKCSAGSNGWYGFWDDSFLGNNFISCHSASNGRGGGLTTGVDPCICYHGGITYGVVPHYEQVTYPLPGATVPGTNADVWCPIVNTASADNWVSGGKYCPGGPYCNTNLNARSVWLGCYAETTAYMWYVGASSSAVLGGLNGGYIVGPSYQKQGNIIANGVSTSANPAPGVACDPFFTTNWGTDASGGQVVRSFTGSTSANQGWREQLVYPTGDVNFYYGTGGLSSYRITGPQTTWDFGCGTPKALVFSVPSLALSSTGADGVKIEYGTGIPNRPAGKGWIIFNSNPVPGGNVGWVCTTAGPDNATAVWKTFGTIAP